MATVPGASRPYKPHSEFFNSQDSLSSEVNGQSRMANNVQIEGLDNNQRTGLLTVLIPPAEAIDAVSVTTSNYDAEFGRAAGAVTSVTLKSGTNQLRGSAFWFGNTEKTNAAPASTYFSTVHTKAPTTLQPVRLHDRRADQEEQVLLLRRLPADPGPPRQRAALRRADRGVPPRATSARRRRRSTTRRRATPPATGGCSSRTTRFPSNRISPIALAAPGEDPAAEPAGRRAGPGQLPGQQLSRQEHRQLRHQVQLRPQRLEPDVGAVQLPAP